MALLSTEGIIDTATILAPYIKFLVQSFQTSD